MPTYAGGVKTAKPLYNEVRYSIFYHNEAAARPSVLLKAGEGMAGSPYGQKKFTPKTSSLDLAMESLDPNGTTVWITHGYASKKGGYTMVWGAVNP